MPLSASGNVARTQRPRHLHHKNGYYNYCHHHVEDHVKGVGPQGGTTQVSGFWSTWRRHSKCRVSGPQGDTIAGVGSLVHRETPQQVSGLWSTGRHYSRCRVSGPRGGTTAGVGSVVHRETRLQMSGLWPTGRHYCKCRVCGPQDTLPQVSGLWSTGPSLWSTGCIVLRAESQAMPLMVTMAQAFGVAAVWHCAMT